MKFSNFMSRGWGFWLPVLSQGEGFCTQWLSGGRVFAPFKSCPGGMVLDEIDTCITNCTSDWLMNIDRGNVNRVVFLDIKRLLIPLITQYS